MFSFTKAGLVGLVGSGALAAALVGAASPAGASTHPVSPKDATLSCQTDPNCFEPVVAVSQTSGTDFTPPNDAALSVVGSQLWTRTRNSLQDGTQDFGNISVGTVPSSGPGDYGFTAFDNSHYAGDQLVQITSRPFAQDTGNCGNITKTTHLGVVQPCGTGLGQVFILAPTAPGLTSPPSGYHFMISVRHANNLQRHLLVTAQQDGSGQISAINGHSGLHEQMWSQLP
jgi:hypothetical protein